MKKTLKIDMHVHSKGISLCSKVSCQTIVDEKLRVGYDGAVLTNHCQPWYYPPAEHSYFIERVIEEFYRGKEYADKKGFRLYLGLEVTIPNPYGDWLLYGVTEDFLRRSPCLYQLTQKQLFELCEENGILLVQAHPFRNGCVLGDPRYMRGMEINCTPGDFEKASFVKEFTEKYNLLVTCGTDYHGIERETLGGILLPSECTTAAEIAAYIRAVKNVKIVQNEKN